MTFEEIYRDVYSKLGLNQNESSIYYYDVVRSINDAIRGIRRQYIQEGMVEGFMARETVYPYKSIDYPFFLQAHLSGQVDHEVPEQFSVFSVNAHKSNKKLPNKAASYKAGDIVKKGDKLYKAYEDITDKNTFDLTFKKSEAKNFKEKNDLTYKPETVIYDIDRDSFYRVVEEYKATESISVEDLDELGQFEKLYWYEVGENFIPTVVHSAHNMLSLRTYNEDDDVAAVFIDKNKVYTTKQVSRLDVQYVPKWDDVESFEQQVNIPDSMVLNVKQTAIQTLASKLGLQGQQVGQSQMTQEDEQ